MSIEIGRLYRRGNDLLIAIAKSNQLSLVTTSGLPLVQKYDFLSLPDAVKSTHTASEVSKLETDNLVVNIRVKTMLKPDTGEVYYELGKFSAAKETGELIISGEGKGQWEEIDMSQWIETYLKASKLVAI